MTFRKDLLKKANDKRKDGLVFSAWSLDGKIFVKTSPEGDPIRIYEQSDLEDLERDCEGNGRNNGTTCTTLPVSMALLIFSLLLWEGI